MYKTRSPSQIPVAVFSRAEVEKYQKYANFATTVVPDSEIPRNSGYASIQKYVPVARKGGGRYKIPKINVDIPEGGKGPAILAALGIASMAAGTAGHIMYLRRRRTKKGKVVVEQVRR